MPNRSDVLRRIAGSELDKLFPDSAPRARDDLITSVVRQWLTCAGHAGVFTVVVNYWLQLEEVGSGYHIRSEVLAGAKLLELLRAKFAIAEDIPRILRDLTHRQNALFENRDGVTFQLSVNPSLRRFAVELVKEDDGSS